MEIFQQRVRSLVVGQSNVFKTDKVKIYHNHVIYSFNEKLTSASSNNTSVKMLGLVTLRPNHPTFNHTTVNHRSVIDYAFSNTPIKTDDNPAGCSEHYSLASQAMFSIETWNHYKAKTAGIAKTTNAFEGWHFGLQALFWCNHPTSLSFVQGIEKDLKMQRSSFLQLPVHKHLLLTCKT